MLCLRSSISSGQRSSATRKSTSPTEITSSTKCTNSSGSSSGSFSVILVSDEVNFWFGGLSWSWSPNSDVRCGFSFLGKDVDESLLLSLFRQDDFSLLLAVSGWSFHENNVHVFVSVAGNTDHSGLRVCGLFWSGVNVSICDKING